MQVDWILLGKALCLVLVIEGLVLALAPQRLRAAAALVLQLDTPGGSPVALNVTVLAGMSVSVAVTGSDR